MIQEFGVITYRAVKYVWKPQYIGEYANSREKMIAIEVCKAEILANFVDEYPEYARTLEKASDFNSVFKAIGISWDFEITVKWESPNSCYDKVTCECKMKKK